ncbi:hypothetical protein FQR65_LT15645 [Abscondita terminalis]|nr:hypothetical protein FQR65_LT15645 [Abscondita terminalis]
MNSFAIVQRRKQLAIVPENWIITEDGSAVVLWLPNNLSTLQKNASSVPVLESPEKWKIVGVYVVKRRRIADYVVAEEILEDMISNSDTDNNGGSVVNQHTRATRSRRNSVKKVSSTVIPSYELDENDFHAPPTTNTATKVITNLDSSVLSSPLVCTSVQPMSSSETYDSEHSSTHTDSQLMEDDTTLIANNVSMMELSDSHLIPLLSGYTNISDMEVILTETEGTNSSRMLPEVIQPQQSIDRIVQKYNCQQGAPNLAVTTTTENINMNFLQNENNVPVTKPQSDVVALFNIIIQNQQNMICRIINLERGLLKIDQSLTEILNARTHEKAEIIAVDNSVQFIQPLNDLWKFPVITSEEELINFEKKIDNDYNRFSVGDKNEEINLPNEAILQDCNKSPVGFCINEVSDVNTDLPNEAVLQGNNLSASNSMEASHLQNDVIIETNLLKRKRIGNFELTPYKMLKEAGINARIDLSPRKNKLYGQIKHLSKKCARAKISKQTFNVRLQEAEKLSTIQGISGNISALNKLAQQFISCQFREAGKSPKQHRFTVNEKLMSLALYKQSHKTYREPFESQELCSMAKLCGHPDIQSLQGIDKLRSRTLQENLVSYSDVNLLLCSMKSNFIEDHLIRYKRWPVRYLDNRSLHYTAFRSVTLEDFTNLSIEKVMEFDYIDSQFAILKDTALSQTRLAITDPLLQDQHKYTPVFISIDVEAFNNNFRRPVCEPVGREFFNKLLGVEHFSHIMDTFEHSLFTIEDGVYDYSWEGQYGGIEGLFQKFLTRRKAQTLYRKRLLETKKNDVSVDKIANLKEQIAYVDEEFKYFYRNLFMSIDDGGSNEIKKRKRSAKRKSQH